MHEYSIVQSLIGLCEEHAKENRAKHVTRVVIKVGKLSGVEPQLLQSAFDTFKEQTVCAEAMLEIQIQPPVVRCRACGEESIIEDAWFRCHHCQSSDVTCIDGEEMFLQRLEME